MHPNTGARSSWHFDAQLTGLAPMADGRFVSTTRHGFAVVDLAAETMTPIATLADEPATNRFNDAKADPVRGVWAGTMDEEKPRRPVRCID
ncbi:MAG: SMP-30/gluconolactonase/LRE family protein [Acidimicrobiales bacterium]